MPHHPLPESPPHTGASGFLQFCLGLQAQFRIQDLLAQADGFGGNLDQLVLGDILDGLLQGHLAGRCQEKSS